MKVGNQSRIQKSFFFWTCLIQLVSRSGQWGGGPLVRVGGGFLLRFDYFEKVVVLVVDVGLLVGHLALPQEVPQVPVLQEPLEKIKEGLLASPQGLFLSGLESQESGEVAGSSYELYFFGVVCPAFVNSAPVGLKQGKDFGGVISACELAYCSSGYVSANVLLVIFAIRGICFYLFVPLFYGRCCFPLGDASPLWMSFICIGAFMRQFFD